MIYNLHQYFCNLKYIPPFRKTMETRTINNIFNKNEKRYSDVKIQKVCGQDRDSNNM